MAQVVEHLPSKHEALSLNPSIPSKEIYIYIYINEKMKEAEMQFVGVI
jgi:hypothetical protein